MGGFGMRCGKRESGSGSIGIAAEHKNVERAERRLRAWAAGVPREHGARLTVRQEDQGRSLSGQWIDDDRDVLDSYGGLNPAHPTVGGNWPR